MTKATSGTSSARCVALPRFRRLAHEPLEKPDSHFLIGEYEGRPGAVALTVEKDARVVKLAAFTVAEFARNTGLGPHLLWAEIRRWVQSGYEKAYVTVSSRRADLLRFFTEFGFLVEGVSPRRYFDNEIEFVLGRHIIRKRLTDEEPTISSQPSQTGSSECQSTDTRFLSGRGHCRRSQTHR